MSKIGAGPFRGAGPFFLPRERPESAPSALCYAALMDEREILGVAEKAARRAGKVLQALEGGALEVRRKGDVDLVTRADRAAEEEIVQCVRELCPDDAILAEERGRLPGSTDRLWVIDPLDGTTNFAHGLPIWSVSIGVLHGGKALAGVVFDPSRRECFTAARGRGCRLDGKACRVSAPASLDAALLVTGFPYDVRTRPERNLEHFSRFLVRARAVRRLGSAALDLAYVACGRFDGFWEPGLHPWDTAAGALLVEESGGQVTRFDGAPFDPFSDEILAAGPALHPALRAVLCGGDTPPSPGRG